MKNRNGIYLVISFVCILFGLTNSFAQSLPSDYPAKPINMVIPFPPGGPTDVTGRVLAEKLTLALGQSVVVDNKPGASGNIAAQLVARAPAD